MNIQVTDENKLEPVFVSKQNSICYCPIDNIKPVKACNVEMYSTRLDKNCSGVILKHKFELWKHLKGVEYESRR